MFGSRMLDPGRRPPGRHAAATSSSATGSSPRSRTPSPARRSQRVALRLPRLLASRRCATSRSTQRRRLRLRHADHRAAPRGGQAHRRDPDPHLLRRRDLPRQRHGVRPRHHRATSSGTGPTRWASAPASWRSPATRTTPRTADAVLARDRAALARRPPARPGARPRLLRRLRSPSGSATAGHHVTGVDLIAHEGVKERVDRFVEADLEQGHPAGASTARST